MPDYLISQQFDTLLHAVYRGPLEDPQWNTFLQLFQAAVQANFATLLLRPPRKGDPGKVLNAVVHSVDTYTAYNDTYFALDPFIDLPADEVVTLQEFLAIDELEGSEYYKQYLQPTNVKHIMGVDIHDEQGLKARLRVTRSESEENFSAAEKTLTQKILPHLKQAILLYSRIVRAETERAFYESTVAQLEMGTIILDESAKVLHMNQAAAQLIERHAMLSICDGRLQLGSRQETSRFRAMVDEVMQAHRESTPGVVRAFRLPRLDATTQLGFLVRPLPIADAPAGDENPSIAIVISDPEQPRNAPLAVLKQLFEFTPAEATLALLLANGLTLDEASQELGITRNTAKSHLSAVFSKTGVTRQPKLVQLILKSVASLG